jgi:serine/threonine protein kinase
MSGYFVQVLPALKAAGREHIVHRDIKPAVMMITEGSRVTVMDFGIAGIGPHSGKALGMPLG